METPCTYAEIARWIGDVVSEWDEWLLFVTNGCIPGDHRMYFRHQKPKPRSSNRVQVADQADLGLAK